MAFTPKSFSGNLGAGSLSQTLYVYKTADTKAATIASGYFNSLAKQLKIGDIILATTDTGTTAVSLALYVATNSGTVVTVGYVAVA
jgi:hypothetical protein